MICSKDSLVNKKWCTDRWISILMKYENSAKVKKNSKQKQDEWANWQTWTALKCPPNAALYKGVRLNAPLELTSAPLFIKNSMVSPSPPAAASDIGVLWFASSQLIRFIWCLKIWSSNDGPVDFRCDLSKFFALKIEIDCSNFRLYLIMMTGLTF